MPRFYIAPEQIRQDRAEINGAEARHILRVLRLGKGDELELFDGMGGLWKARIENVERGRLVAKLLEQRSHKTESPLKITLVQALIKADKLELIIKGAAELGASHIVILRTARARRVITSDFEHRLIRWRKLLKQAAKQCGRARLPQIEFFCWEEFWRCEIDAELKIILWEAGQVQGMQEVLTLAACSGRSALPEQAALMVGPEGGFNRAEVTQAKAAGFVPASLGSRILRTETAALAALALIQYELGDLK